MGVRWSGVSGGRWGGGVRALVVLLTLLGVIVLGAGAVSAQVQDEDAPSAAEADETSDAAGADDEDDAATDEDDDREAERRVERIVLALVAIAVVALLSTVAFWYHTIPSRRVIAARRKRARAARGSPDRDGASTS
jgi:hypothetical protein